MPRLSPNACARALPYYDSKILHCMVRIDLKIALTANIEVHLAVARQKIEHVLHKGNPNSATESA